MATVVGNDPGRVSGTARSVYNTLLRFAPITVTNTATSLPATTYSDPNLATANSSLQSDVNGVYAFYVSPGTYSIAITSPLAGEPADNPPNVTVRGDNSGNVATAPGSNRLLHLDRGGAFSGLAASNSQWRSALSAVRRGTGNAKVVCYGDSVTNGTGSAGPLDTTSWPERLRSMLNSYLTAANVGVVWFGTAGATTRYAIGSGWGQPASPPMGLAGSTGIVGTTTATGTLDVGPFTCDTFELWYVNTGAGGAFDTWVDSGSHTTRTISGGAGINSVVISAGSLASHTLHVGNIATTTFYGIACEARAGSSGLYLSRGGVPGTLAAYWAQTNGTWQSIEAIKAVPHDLAIVMLTTNDYVLQSTLSSYRTAIDAIVVALQSVNSSILLVVAPQPTTANLSIPYSSYVDQVKSVRDARGTDYLNIAERWASAGVTSTASMSDAVHPNDDAHNDIARAVFDVITQP